MGKITIIAGATGVGKSSYIKKYIAENPLCHHLDIPGAWRKKYGHCKELMNQEEGLDLELYFEISDKAFFALDEGKELLIEYNLDGNDQGLKDIVYAGKESGIDISLVVLDTSPEVARERLGNASSDYFSSFYLKEMTENIRNDRIDSHVLNRNLMDF